MSSQVAVAATGVQARDAGLGVVEDGGNAVDAAVAAALVAMSTEPGIVSLAGGGYVTLWPVGGAPIVLDGGVAMPGLGAPTSRRGTGVREVVTDYGGGLTLLAGAGSVAVPGAVQALALASERHGGLPWSRLVAPAEAAVREGYPTSHAGALYLGFVAQSLFGLDAGSRALVTGPDGGRLAPGERAVNPDLADTLAALAEQGPALMVTGEVGRRLVAQMAELEGLLGPADLAAYEVQVRPALVREVGEWRVALNPPPAVGGTVLAVMLAEVARRTAPGAEVDLADVLEVQRTVLGSRLDVLDTAADLETAGLALLESIDRDGLTALPTSPSTAHVSAVDHDGLACAITVSSGYGAGLCIPGTGVLLNNCLGERELNRRGLHAGEPGRRVATNMAPTVARAADGRALAIGSPGADRITTALLQVLAPAMLSGLGLQEALDRPRLHLRRTSAWTVEHEPDPAIADAVARSGLAGHAYDGPHMYFGGVGAALRRADGVLEAAGDARREAAVGVSEPG